MRGFPEVLSKTEWQNCENHKICDSAFLFVPLRFCGFCPGGNAGNAKKFLTALGNQPKIRMTPGDVLTSFSACGKHKRNRNAQFFAQKRGYFKLYGNLVYFFRHETVSGNGTKIPWQVCVQRRGWTEPILAFSRDAAWEKRSGQIERGMLLCGNGCPICGR